MNDFRTKYFKENLFSPNNERQLRTVALLVWGRRKSHDFKEILTIKIENFGWKQRDLTYKTFGNVGFQRSARQTTAYNLFLKEVAQLTRVKIHIN